VGGIEKGDEKGKRRGMRMN